MSLRNYTDPKFLKTFFTPDRYSHDKIPQLNGKVAIVTGANTGIGYATTVALAAHGAHVFMACRSERKCNEAISRIREEIKQNYPPSSIAEEGPLIEFLQLDLNDMNATQESAKRFLDKGLPLHILINNGGIGASPFTLSADGIEQMFAVNHLGHFVFTTALLGRLKESQPSRIVVVSSMSHEISVEGGIDLSRINDETEGNINRYGRSKFANILFVKALARRLANERVFCNAAHPGIIDTQMAQGFYETLGPFKARILRMITLAMSISKEKGALTSLYCATSPEIETMDFRGRFFIPIANEVNANPLTDNVELQEELWTFSEKLVEEKVKSRSL
ncbi:hypothetical protein BGZ72_009356 [Mortierella alpina]|nr:hypothetical protein BGZ72_009356 [Mortierella alpina]